MAPKISGHVYKNVNGKVLEDRDLSEKEIANTISFGDFINSAWDPFEKMFDKSEPLFTIPRITFDDFCEQPIVRLNKSSASADWPKSDSYVDESKKIYWNVALTGLGEDGVSIDADDGVITIEVLKDVEDSIKKAYDYKNLKLPKKGDTLKVKYDPKIYDVETFSAKLTNGLLTMSMDPREELKPVKKHLFGAEKTTEVKVETKEDSKSE